MVQPLALALAKPACLTSIGQHSQQTLSEHGVSPAQHVPSTYDSEHKSQNKQDQDRVRSRRSSGHTSRAAAWLLGHLSSVTGYHHHGQDKRTAQSLTVEQLPWCP